MNEIRVSSESSARRRAVRRDEKPVDHVPTAAADIIVALGEEKTELLRLLEQARNWATTLEGQNAEALRIARDYTCDHAGFDLVVAALTGGEQADA